MWISRLRGENGAVNNNNSPIVPLKMLFGTWSHHLFICGPTASTAQCKPTVKHVDHVTIFIQTMRNRPVLLAELHRPSETIWTGGQHFITLERGGDQPHLMKAAGQGRIKSRRPVSCSAICTLPLIHAVGQWHSRRRRAHSGAGRPGPCRWSLVSR